MEKPHTAARDALLLVPPQFRDINVWPSSISKTISVLLAST